jgi:phosphatidate cytidylyltransferase
MAASKRSVNRVAANPNEQPYSLRLKMARTISALILVPLALLAVIYATPIIFLIGIGIVGTACLYEYFRLVDSMHIQARPWFGYAVFWILLIAFRQSRFPAAVMIALVMIAYFLSSMWRYKLPVRERVFGLMAELLGVFYCTLFLYPALPVRYDFGNKIGLHWMLLLLLVVWTGDTVALVVGKTLGRSPFAPVLSPKKTNEGAMAGLLAGLCVAVGMQHFLLTDLPIRHVAAVSILLGIFGQLGDLAESMLKRAAEIKDSSHLIPGHGGVLDRMDSLLFAFPVLYFYLLQIY